MPLTTTPCGRFAPSPTGPLHAGSLLAAMGSYLQARHAGGHWLLRIEDIDPPREMPGATQDILKTLADFGFKHYGEIGYQSQQGHFYDAALQQLADNGLLYACDCSRKQIRQNALATTHPQAYPGTCRDRGLPLDGPYALRLKLPKATTVGFDDGIQGYFEQNVAEACGDFVLKRRDGLFAYQLAVVVDDALSGVTQVVRGADLLDNTPRQILLQRALGVNTPDYAHLPVVVNSAGEKLSKQTYAPALDSAAPLNALWQAWTLLGQTQPISMAINTVEDFWDFALQHWHPERIPGGPLRCA